MNEIDSAMLLQVTLLLTHNALCAPGGIMPRGTAVHICVLVPTLALILAVFYGGITIYQSEDPKWSTARLAAYTALCRPAWSFGLCVLCILWFSNRRSPLSAMLSAGFWYVACG